MSIVFVAGLPGGGKSTFIKKNFPNRTVIAIDDFQKNMPLISPDAIWKTYEKCCEALVLAIKKGENVVLEHTLLRAERRKYYIDAVKAITDEPIDMYFVAVDEKTYTERINARDKERGLDNNPFLEPATRFVKRHLELMELPTPDEGFDKVYIIKE